jgi:hypothetical protein
MLRVFQNRVLRKIFVPKKDEVTEEWRRLHREKLYDLYFPLNIPICVIKSRKTRRGAWHLLGCTRFWLGNLREGDYFEDIGLDKGIY